MTQDLEVTLLIEMLDLISNCASATQTQRVTAAHYFKRLSNDFDNLLSTDKELTRLLVSAKDLFESGPIGYIVSDTKQFHYIGIVHQAQQLQ